MADKKKYPFVFSEIPIVESSEVPEGGEKRTAYGEEGVTVEGTLVDGTFYVKKIAWQTKKN